LAGTPFFRKRGVGCIKKGAGATFFLKKGAIAPFLREIGFPAKKTYRNVPTEISFGIDVVNTKKYRPIPTGKYQSKTIRGTKNVPYDTQLCPIIVK
jgi:hypothetical protein